MNIHAVLATNNEGDILSHCIKSALEWAHRVYIFDTGSTDNTRDVIDSFTLDPRFAERVIHYKSEFRQFNWAKSTNEVFRQYFSNSKPGDWWCTLCTDEIYRDNPLEFISRIPPQYNCVWMIMINYYFTEKDLCRFFNAFGTRSLDELSEMHDFFRTLNYYTAAYSEPRFFKHTSSTKPTDLFTIKNFNRPWYDRLFMNHYQYRYPAQIMRRVNDRVSVYKNSGALRFFYHENDFRVPTLSSSQSDYGAVFFRDSGVLSRVVLSSCLNSDSGPIAVDYSAMPRPNYSFQLLAGMALVALRDRCASGISKLSHLGVHRFKRICNRFAF